MGRKRKPIGQQIAEGDPRQRGKHKLEAKAKQVPKPARGLLECPAHLTGRARAAWQFWAPELETMDLDARCDAPMLEGACLNYARAVEADLRVAKDGIIVEEPILVRGKRVKDLVRLKKHPAIAVSNAAWEKVRSFRSEFGLSPAVRSRLNVSTPAHETDADVERLLHGPTLTDEEKQKMQ